jgi:integrase
MREHTHAGMSLYGSAGGRKYLNAAERRRFAKAALRTPLEVQLFCIVLSLTGGRISEILAVTPAAIDIDSGVANSTTLKRRKLGIVRQVHLPRSVIGKLEITPTIFGDVNTIQILPLGGSGNGAERQRGGGSRKSWRRPMLRVRQPCQRDCATALA